MIEFKLIDKRYRITNIVGDIRFFAREDDPLPLKEQFNKNYSFGGGWRPMEGFTMDENKNITYPEDPPLTPIAKATFRDQEIYMYHYSWVAIVNADGSFEVSRMD